MLEKAEPLGAAPSKAEHKKPPKAPQAEGSEGFKAAGGTKETHPQTAQEEKGEPPFYKYSSVTPKK